MPVDPAIRQHKKLRGKIRVSAKQPIRNLSDLAVYYTPGVGRVSKAVFEHPELAREVTGINNSVVVISDGSAVLGLGNIGPQAALPVMEGKAMLFNQFAGIDSIPIVLNVHSVDEIVSAVKAIAPSFGAINLEDIAAPGCFEIEERLKSDLSIPVMHDDQHGTAIVVLAGLINAQKVTGKNIASATIVVNGIGAAGTAILKLLMKQWPSAKYIALDSVGTLSAQRSDMNEQKRSLLPILDDMGAVRLQDAIQSADVFIGVSAPGVLTEKMVRSMNANPIVFAMANPDPEILPHIAKKAGAAVIATGRSDFPNQINNALAFPGIFRGALDNAISTISDSHKLAAALAIARLVDTPSSDHIVPDVFDKRLVPAVANVIR